jgi:hypothetical protein
MPPQSYQTSEYVVPGGGIFLGKWRSSFAGSSDGKMNVHISLRSEHPVHISQVIPYLEVFRL